MKYILKRWFLLTLLFNSPLSLLAQKDNDLVPPMYAQIMEQLTTYRSQLAKQLCSYIPKEQKPLFNEHFQKIASLPMNNIILRRFAVFLGYFPKSFDLFNLFQDFLNQLFLPLTQRNASWTPTIRFMYLQNLLYKDYMKQVHKYNQNPHNVSIKCIIEIFLREIELIHIQNHFYSKYLKSEINIRSLRTLSDSIQLKQNQD